MNEQPSMDEQSGRFGATGVPWRAPRTPLESKLCALFGQTLGLDCVGVDDDFFELGGHSLLALRFARRASVDIDPRIETALLYEAPTVRRLAALLENLQ